ncbi:MgtC/SapB family protein (plasmid) [Paenarthrobacter sp. OM7]|uniref:MgtC/SapB family protein n=1 Tax=Paenarthrobacter sp. OM7 TaxID=3041264 RepID=UPI002468DCAF|nr:MgtC/SapB family protein [Paenarthrobacter sp. OM7]WGM22853.1 MgtC/SapB family protein [Paenarthrobacter sp. OM7]
MLHIDWVNNSTLTELALVGMAYVLSALVGIERHRQVKSAGLRTHTLVGLGAAVFTLVSGYGFSSITTTDVILDPSRIAAQIVSGVGFLGAGVIFVRQNVVSGLTTAASVWLVAAIGMACGAGMPVLAATGTVLHLLTVTLLSRVARQIPVAGRGRDLTVHYGDGKGTLRLILERATELGFEVALKGTRRQETARAGTVIEANLRFNRGRVSIDHLVEQLTDVSGVQRVVNAAGADSSL